LPLTTRPANTWLADLFGGRNRLTVSLNSTFEAETDTSYANLDGNIGPLIAADYTWAANVALYFENEHWLTKSFSILTGFQAVYVQRNYHDRLNSPVDGNQLTTRISGLRPHSEKQATIASLFKQLLPDGRTFTECPISTSDGVKATDVAWLSSARSNEADTQTCLSRAPDICVEILSPSNTAREIEEKIALYFESGASEVWVCQENGTLLFHSLDGLQQASRVCRHFPAKL
jgi:hypothetical protein